ncbi:hypothetical protein SO694_00008126 [Aureococcus anophagefferens]|uniref:Uncharacterized protein n=1 Tax=Aureococcus anophagefferens TaxID=44056 RepID=A0ABR1GDC5_AURAN
MRSSTPPRRRTPPGSPRSGAAGSPPATPERPVTAGRVSSGARSAADFSPRHSSGDRAWERALHRRIEALELQLQAEIAANRDLRSGGAPSRRSGGPPQLAPSPKKSPRATPEKADDAGLLDEVRADATADEARLLAQVAAAERENRAGRGQARAG